MPTPTKYSTLPTLEKMALILQWVDEKKGLDTLALDLTGCHSLAEATCIVTATSARHAQGLAEFVSEQGRRNNLEQLHMEGFQTAQWILIDFNDIIIHILQPEARLAYRLDDLWGKSRILADQRQGAAQ